MTIIAACPCGQKFQVQDQMAGQRVNCTTCGQAFVIGAPVDPLEQFSAALPSAPDTWQTPAGGYTPPMSYQTPGYTPAPAAGAGQPPRSRNGSRKILLVSGAIGAVFLLLCVGGTAAYFLLPGIGFSTGHAVLLAPSEFTQWETIQHPKVNFTFEAPVGSEVSHTDSTSASFSHVKLPNGGKILVSFAYTTNRQVDENRDKLEAELNDRSLRSKRCISFCKVPADSVDADYCYEKLLVVKLNSIGVRMLAVTNIYYTIQYVEPPGRSHSSDMQRCLNSFKHNIESMKGGG